MSESENEMEIDNDALATDDDLLPLRSSSLFADDSDDGDDIDLQFEAQPVRCAFLTGAAGTGKTYQVRERIAADQREGQLCATTGIAGVNLGTVTINSLLRYFDTESLINAYVSGRLVSRLARLGSRVRNLYIDEVSMMPAEQLDTLYQATQEANRRKMVTKINPEGLGLVLVGDLCLAIGTQVMMADGSLRAVETIRIGEFVMGPDSTPRKVLRTTLGVDKMYRVDQSNGDSYTVNSQHLLSLTRSSSGRAIPDRMIRRRYANLDQHLEMTAPAFMAQSGKFKECFVGYKTGLIKFKSKPIGIDPYLLGLWLGDGDSDGIRITTAEPEVLEFCQSQARLWNLGVTIHRWMRTDAVRIRLTNGRKASHVNPLWALFRAYELNGNKHIPTDYLVNDENVRLKLLAGLIDSDGSWSGNRYRITLKNERLIYQVKRLVDQLGFRGAIRFCGDGAWTVTIGGDTWRIPCRVARKQSNVRSLGRSRLTSVLTVTPVGIGAYAGFTISGDHRFLLADGTVTHNCQLPPIKARWLFEAECWERFDEGTTRLEKNWRQADEEFLDAINYLRAGRGEEGASTLRQTPIEFTSALDLHFPGTTIMAKNEEVDRFNWQALQRVRGEKFTINSKRWHVSRGPGEWKNIPERLELKIGAYVMILANDTREFTYANGDCGLVVGRDSTSVQIRLARNDDVVEIGSIERKVHSPDSNDFGADLPKSPTWGSPWFDEQAEKYCIGSVRYLPLRLAWASTVHKSQGLTLDRVQLDLRNHFFSQPAMAYVAVSRCRTPEGLRVVGDEKLLASRCKIDPRVQRWV